MLYGRDGERAAIALLIGGAQSSRSGTLVLRGQPGVGKSALLGDALTAADGMLVLSTQGSESELPLAFAALQRLLRPILPLADRLPEHQRDALAAAFGEQPSVGVDRFLVFVASLSLLAEAADDRPVLCVVDDAHWLDDASAAALLFVARRLQAERIALLFAARDGDVRAFDSGELPVLALTGIDPAAAALLLERVAGLDVPAGVRDYLMTETGGNPLALVELPTVLSPQQIQGTAPLPLSLPLTERVEKVFLDRARRLTAGGQTVLLVAAADDSSQWSTVRTVAGTLGASEQDMESAEQSGLVQVSGPDFGWRHPLVRSAVYQAATSRQRMRVHRALGEAVVAASDADRRTWHLAAGTDPPDDLLAAELERTAGRAQGRGGYEAASLALERAADFTTGAEAGAQLLMAAATNGWLAGQTVRTRHLIDRALSMVEDPVLRSDIDRLRGRIEFNEGSLTTGISILTEAARRVAEHDARRALELLMIASALSTFTADPDSRIDIAELPPAARPDAPPRQRLVENLLTGFVHVSNNDIAGAAPHLQAALSLAGGTTETELLTNLGIAAFYLGDDEAFRRGFSRVLAGSRESGAVGMVLFALPRLGLADLVTAEWTLLEAHASEALELARSIGRDGLTPMPLAQLTMVAALRGDEAFGARRAETELAMGPEPVGVLGGLTRDVLQWATGIRAASQGRADEALHQLERMAHPALRRFAALDRIEAAVRSGETEGAAGWVSDLDDFAQATQASWAAAVVAHGRALLAGPPESDELFAAALKLHETARRPFERARCQLAFGEHLRRTRRRVEAREHLRTALRTFEDLGTKPWVERCTQELRASGETARKREPGAPPPGLTPQELQVAWFVSQGLSNRDVAAQLFLSPRTIDFHLRNVFTKVGVSSRGELTRLELGGAGGAGGHPGGFTGASQVPAH